MIGIVDLELLIKLWISFTIINLCTESNSSDIINVFYQFFFTWWTVSSWLLAFSLLVIAGEKNNVIIHYNIVYHYICIASVGIDILPFSSHKNHVILYINI